MSQSGSEGKRRSVPCPQQGFLSKMTAKVSKKKTDVAPEAIIGM